MQFEDRLHAQLWQRIRIATRSPRQSPLNSARGKSAPQHCNRCLRHPRSSVRSIFTPYLRTTNSNSLQNSTFSRFAHVLVSGHNWRGKTEYTYLLRSDTPEKHRFDSPSWQFLIQRRSHSEYRWTSVERERYCDVGMERLHSKSLMRACPESDSSGASRDRSNTSNL